MLPHQLDVAKSLAVRQAKVQQDQVRLLALCRRDAFRSRRRVAKGKATLLAESPLEQRRVDFVVVEDQDRQRTRGQAAARSASTSQATTRTSRNACG